MKEWKCLDCGKVLEPTEDNTNYFMCYPCVKGWSREELERKAIENTLINLQQMKCVPCNYCQVSLKNAITLLKEMLDNE